MRVFRIISNKGTSSQHGEHFCEECARKTIASTHYTDKAGVEHIGEEHWSIEQIRTLTASMSFPEGTTRWDKYVAFNTMYFDLCRILDEPTILKVAHTFYFQDEDAPTGKIKRYIEAMTE